jgi:F-type H+-transporting ATPase subunit a
MFATILVALALTAGSLQQESPLVDGAMPDTAGHVAVYPPETEGGDIMHHILDERVLKTPFGYVDLPAAHSWQVGPLDMTPTKYVVFLWITGALVLLLILPAAQAAKRRQNGDAPAGGQNVVETMILFFRDQVIMPNIGHGGERFAPFILTLFFFILTANLLGLIPYGGSVTASISVTGALAILSFITIEIAGMRALGFKGYLGTAFYWNTQLALPLRLVLFVILSIVEIVGKFVKPFALAIRLMANMVAGKIVIYSLIGLVFVFGSYAIAVGPVVMTVALTLLKIFVGFLQAYIFALLTSVFIGLIRHAHH